jgi:hypothetical protein
MPKLHELLAVRENARGQSEKVRQGLMHTFDKKRHLFEEKRVTFQSSKEGEPERTEAQTLLQSTIAKELQWLTPIVAGAINIEVAIDIGNVTAKADIVLEDGKTIVTTVPATALLQLGKRLHEVKVLVEAIPTLDPAKSFEPDTARGEGVFKAREVTKTRTSKEQIPIVLYDATDKHPAQTQLITKDVPVGTIREQEWSGLITPAEKAAMIERVEKLIRAVAAALSRANDAEVSNNPTVGQVLLNYVFSGQLSAGGSSADSR